jgi:hypothetical protein
MRSVLTVWAIEAITRNLVSIACAQVTGPASIPESPEKLTNVSKISGMARIGKEPQFLVVRDEKGETKHARFGIVTIEPGSAPSILPLVDAAPPSVAPFDLEAVCLLDEQPESMEFLAFESGRSPSEDPSRIPRFFQVSLTLKSGTKNAWTLKTVRVFQRMGGKEQIEGAVCIGLGQDRYTLVLGERGDRNAKPSVQGRLRWGVLDIDNPSSDFRYDDEGGQPLDTPPWDARRMDRDCGDLFLDDSKRLWSAGTDDAGDDGPFRSILYSPGRVAIDATGGVLIDPTEPVSSRYVDGLKIEALGPPVVKDSAFTVATDDENYGSIVRPLR